MTSIDFFFLKKSSKCNYVFDNKNTYFKAS